MGAETVAKVEETRKTRQIKAEQINDR